MPQTLILIRHGNTFDPGQTVLRVGRRTDLPLSSSGRAQATALGAHLLAAHGTPSQVWVSPLRRTQETAAYALGSVDSVPIDIHPALNEIDYGMDDGQPEDMVAARLGPALETWETHGTMPPEWSPRPDVLAEGCREFLAMAAAARHPLAWALSSNGLLRFFAALAEWRTPRPDSLKVKTAAFARLVYKDSAWHIEEWNTRAP
jgi:probable phosphoglycerate mutase